MEIKIYHLRFRRLKRNSPTESMRQLPRESLFLAQIANKPRNIFTDNNREKFRATFALLCRNFDYTNHLEHTIIFWLAWDSKLQIELDSLATPQ